MIKVDVAITCHIATRDDLSRSQVLAYLPEAIRGEAESLQIDPKTPNELIEIRYRTEDKESRNRNFYTVRITLSSQPPSAEQQHETTATMHKAFSELLALRRLVDPLGLTLEMRWIPSTGIKKIGDKTVTW
ncbi:MAG: hypothetical protein ABI397_02715 [Candidatus Saccharimonas sp.]